MWFQMWNHEDLMLTNGSIEYLYSIENKIFSIKGSIKNTLTQCGIVTTLCFSIRAYDPHLSEKLPK